MKNANTNNEKTKYLTYEDVKSIIEKQKSLKSLSIEKIYRETYSYDKLIKIQDNINVAEYLFGKILKLNPTYQDIILNFSKLVNTNEKYIIIDNLLTVIDADITYEDDKTGNIIDQKDKLDILNKKLDIFKSIESNIIKNLIKDYRDNFIYLLLNDETLYNSLLSDKEFMKQAKNYNEVLNIFPQLKDNQR